MARQDKTVSRRTAIKSLGAASAISVAGCLGGDDSYMLDFGISSTGTTAGEAAQALQRTINEHSDDVDIRLEETGGDPASIRLFDSGDIEGHTMTNYLMGRALDDRDPFADPPVDNFAQQGFRFAALHFSWYGVEGTNYNTSEDIIGENVWPLDPDFGVRLAAIDIYEEAGLDEELLENEVAVDVSDVAGAIEEGRIDAFIGYGQNFHGVAGWATEVDAREEVYAIETSEEVTDAVPEVTGVSLEEDMELYGWDQDIGLDATDTWGIEMQFYFGEDVPDDVVYEIAEISHEHDDTAREAMAAYFDPAEQHEFERLESLPVHDGMLSFLDDNGYDID